MSIANEIAKRAAQKEKYNETEIKRTLKRYKDPKTGKVFWYDPATGIKVPKPLEPSTAIEVDPIEEKEDMSISVPGTIGMNLGTGGGGGGYRRRRRYGGGGGYRNNYYKKEFYKLKKFKSRALAAGKAQKKILREEKIAGVDFSGDPALVKAHFGESWKSANEIQRRNRQIMNFQGKGDYRSWLAHISRGVGAVAGGAMGYMGGGLGGLGAGAQSGYNQGGSFSKFMGWGDYGTSTNQIIGGGNKGQMSVNMGPDMSGDIYICQTEFLQNVACTNTGAGASPFQITTFPINAGLAVTFPFLSQIAQNYTLYEFEGLIFKFNPTSGENNATSNSLGKVILATQYDPDAGAFINSVQMENYDYANAAKPSQTIFHGVETDNQQQAVNMQYIRTGTTTKSKVFTDIGTFFVATEGVPFAAAGTQILGELWVTYKIKLSRANLYGALLGQNISQDLLGGASSVAALSTGTAFRKSTNQIGMVVFPLNATAFSIQFPSNITLGTFLVLVRFTSGATAFTTQSGTLPTAPVNLQFFSPGVSLPSNTGVTLDAPVNPLFTTQNQAIDSVMFVTVAAPGNTQATFQFNTTAALSATTTWLVYVTQINQIPSLTLT